MSVLGCWLLSAALGASIGSDVSYVDASMQFEERVLSHRFVHIRAAGPKSLCVALRLPGGRRELRIFELEGLGLSPTPVYVVPVLEDVIAYAFADVREEDGRELVFLTRSGAWSYSLTKEGYRGNIARLVEEDLLYDVPGNRSLPYWPYCIPGKDRDSVLLPGREGYSISGPLHDQESSAGATASYGTWATFSKASATAERPISSTAASRQEVRIAFEGSSNLFLGEDRQDSVLLSDSKSYGAPALVDVNGDGQMDLVIADEQELRVHLSRDGRISSQTPRIETLPEYLEADDARVSLDFVDVNNDGLQDLIALVEEDIDGFKNGNKRLLVLMNDGQRLLPPQPQQVMRFEAAVIRYHVGDVDGDGMPDLVLRKFNLPSMLGAVTGLEFELTHLIFLGQKRAKSPFERKPAMKSIQLFNENTVGGAIKNRKLEADCDGDGIADLVEVDLEGRIVIRRVRRESSFFSGDSWELDKNPWKRFDTPGTTTSTEVLDVNQDGLGDVVSAGEYSLTIYLSSRKN